MHASIVSRIAKGDRLILQNHSRYITTQHAILRPALPGNCPVAVAACSADSADPNLEIDFETRQLYRINILRRAWRAMATKLNRTRKERTMSKDHQCPKCYIDTEETPSQARQICPKCGCIAQLLRLHGRVRELRRRNGNPRKALNACLRYEAEDSA